MDDVCPHCKSSARAIPYYERTGNALKRTFDGGAHEGELVCDACGGARGGAGGGGATPAGGEGPAASTDLAAATRSASLARASAGGLRGLGIASIGIGALLALALGAAGLGAVGLVAAVVALGVGGGIGALSLRGASRRTEDAQARLQAATEKALLAAAAASSDCALTATEASRALGIGVAEADRALTAMADGSRVSAEIDPDGIIHYEFRELRLALAEQAGDQVRAPELEPARVEVAATEPAEAQVGADAEADDKKVEQ